MDGERTVKRKFGMTLMMAAALVAVGCARMGVVQDVNNEHVHRYDGKSLTIDEMAHVVADAAVKEGWQPQLESPGHMVVTKRSSNEWSVSVDVLYTADEFSIHYKNSQGLKYNPRTHQIHRNYPGWILDLDRRIQETAQDLMPVS